MQFSVDVGDLTRAEQKILEFINTNRDTFLYLSTMFSPIPYTVIFSFIF